MEFLEFPEDLWNRIKGAFVPLEWDERLGANSLFLLSVLAVLSFAWLLVRRILLLLSRDKQLSTGLDTLDASVRFVSRQAHLLFAKLFFLATFVSITTTAACHMTGRHIPNELSSWIRDLTAEELASFGILVGQLAGLAFAAYLAMGIVKRLAKRWRTMAVKSFPGAFKDGTLDRWFLIFNGYAKLSILLCVIWGTAYIFRRGSDAWPLVYYCFRLMTIVLVAHLLAVGFRVIAQPLTDVGNRRFSSGPLRHYWERLARLIPLGQRCFEAAAYITAATFAVEELDFIQAVAEYGPRIVRCIGIFFLARVIVEFLQVLLYESFGLFADGPTVDPKHQTLVPLLHSGLQYVVYFGALVMMLSALGVDTAPILAGAGIVGLAVGLGAQNLVSDMVSGLFILFESQFLVGDVVEIGSAKGTVEAIAVRHTEVRDDQGRLHLIPNGQIKEVINSSKGFVNAVIDLKIPLGSDVEATMRSMNEAGKQLRQTRREVLSDTVVQGVIELNLKDVTIRATTRVRPGTQKPVEMEYRRLLERLIAPRPPESASRAA